MPLVHAASFRVFAVQEPTGAVFASTPEEMIIIMIPLGWHSGFARVRKMQPRQKWKECKRKCPTSRRSEREEAEKGESTTTNKNQYIEVSVHGEQ
jgi:hypothetical protein